MKISTWISLLLSLAVFAQASPETTNEPLRIRTGFQWSDWERLAIQDRGRVKPLHTFADESLHYISGKTRWKSMSAMEVTLGWLIAMEAEWANEPFILIEDSATKKALGLTPTRKHFSPSELNESTALPELLRKILPKQRRKEALTADEKALVTLQNRRGLVDAIASGRSWFILPSPEGVNGRWYSLSELSDRTLAETYSTEQIAMLAEKLGQSLKAFQARSAEGWNSASPSLAEYVSVTLGKMGYPEQASLSREIHYNNFRPFRLSWILYVLSFCILLAAIATEKPWFERVGLLGILAGFSVHTYGFILRILISGRPPVTNMYESVLWVSWGCVLFSGIIWALYKNLYIPTAAVVFSILGLVLADNVPFILDPSIQPLEPVLRSNFWLTIHVLTITLSYAAFALSLCLGNVVIGFFLWKPTHTKEIQIQSLYMYRAMQIGVILLAAGTILGGIWADYSWGRFWGWDPKEVWALIALLLYLAVLHGRFTGWLKGFGFAATTVISFLGVLMAWYGVNFVLGAGLHSYGFGSGGLTPVAAYVTVQLAFIAFAYRAHRKYGKAQSSIFPGRR